MKKFSRKRENTLFQVPEEGFYQAKIIHWKDGKPRNTVMGLTPSVIITFDLGNGVKVMQSMLDFVGPTSLLDKLFEVTVSDEEEEIAFDDLLGKVCGVEIQHNHVGETRYANVVDVFHVSELEDEEEYPFEDEEQQEEEDPLDNWPDGLD
jgi:hypothetical protein